MRDISILCVTRGDAYALPFLQDMAELAGDLDCPLVVAADGDPARRVLASLGVPVAVTVRSHGYIESVLDQALGHVNDGWVLRLDDDERVSFGMYEWLLDRAYRDADHWCFPRANLYPDENHRLAGIEDGYQTGGMLWPDLQTRLSTKAKSGGRTVIHQGSPYGSGRVAPVVIEHHKLIVRTKADRLEQAARYDRIHAKAGTGPNFGPYQVPELWPHQCHTVPYREAVPV